MTIMYHMSEKINYILSKILLVIFILPLMISISSCGNKGLLTVPGDRTDQSEEQ